jgi:hypothetical protein
MIYQHDFSFPTQLLELEAEPVLDFIPLLDRVAGRPSFFMLRCNPGAKGVPKHGNYGHCGQNYPEIRDYIDAVPPYVRGGHNLL